MERRKLLACLLLAACHGGGGGLIDAPPGDAGDAAIDADTSALIVVTVSSWTGDGQVDPTAIVVFADAAGNVVQHGPVDASGQASGHLGHGGSITVLQAANDPTNFYRRTDRLTTVRGVKPGDQLSIGRPKDPSYRSGRTDPMTFDYTPKDPAKTASPFVACASTSAGSGPSFSLIFSASCETSTFDLLTLDDDSGGNRFYVWQPGLTFTANATITVPNTWQAVAQDSITLLNVPANLANLGLELDIVVGGTPGAVDKTSLSLPPAGTNTASLRYAPATGPSMLQASYLIGITRSSRYVVTSSQPQASITLDYAALALPNVTRVTQSAAGLSWTETRAGTPDARIATWYAMWTDGNSVKHEAFWEVEDDAQPSPSITLPALPAAYAADDPTAATVQLGEASVEYIDYDNLGGYDAARPYGPDLERVDARFLSVEHGAHFEASGS